MDNQISIQQSSSRREREHAELLKHALARPGVGEMMDVYDNWLENDRGLNCYRAATKKSARITNSNSSNSSKLMRTKRFRVADLE